MKIGLIDVDGHNYPNLALMKISAFHKGYGDSVEWYCQGKRYDIVYQTKVFDDTYSADIDFIPNADKVIKGGTGYGIDNELPYVVEHMYPDYSIYPEYTSNTAYGFLTRGCPRHCSFCIVGDKEGLISHKVADLSEFWRGQKYIELLDPNLLACKTNRIELLNQLSESNAYVNFSQGLDIRLMNDECIEIINRIKLKQIHFAWDNAAENLESMFENYARKARHKPHGSYGSVYVLTNYNTTMDENLYRIYTLRKMGFDPDVRIYDKPKAPREIRLLQRWCNNKIIFRSCDRFEDYDPKKG